MGTYSWNGQGTITLDTTKGPEIYFLRRLESSPYGMPANAAPQQDQVGSVSSALPPYPYGESYSPGTDRVGFATYTSDSETGLDYAWNRYYSGNWSRFLSVDPAISSMDPDGRKASTGTRMAATTR